MRCEILVKGNYCTPRGTCTQTGQSLAKCCATIHLTYMSHTPHTQETYLGGVYVVSGTRIIPHELLFEASVLIEVDVLNLCGKAGDSINSDSRVLWKVSNEKRVVKWPNMTLMP